MTKKRIPKRKPAKRGRPDQWLKIKGDPAVALSKLLRASDKKPN